jgi:hypothetical protein
MIHSAEPLLHSRQNAFCESVHKEASENPKLNVILQDKCLLLFENVRIMKGKKKSFLIKRE